jgi:hypothetical protein
VPVDRRLEPVDLGAHGVGLLFEEAGVDRDPGDFHVREDVHERELDVAIEAGHSEPLEL